MVHRLPSIGMKSRWLCMPRTVTPQMRSATARWPLSGLGNRVVLGRVIIARGLVTRVAARLRALVHWRQPASLRRQCSHPCRYVGHGVWRQNRRHVPDRRCALRRFNYLHPFCDHILCASRRRRRVGCIAYFPSPGITSWEPPPTMREKTFVLSSISRAAWACAGVRMRSV